MNFDPNCLCPLCGSNPEKVFYPYSTKFNNIHFNYLKCSKCPSVFVHPIPDSATLDLMYSKTAYHDKYSNDNEEIDFTLSINLLKQYAQDNA
jgi:hypothetical protein